MIGTAGSRAGTVDQILGLYEQFGIETYDEQVTQLDHALQTAALAAADDAAETLVAAALLHDVGHLLDLAGVVARSPRWSSEPLDLCHEQVGSWFLAGLFPPAITAPIALHVSAKRYLTATEPNYSAGLSAGSLASLARQGGPMNETDVRSFENKSHATDSVRLRRWDDAAKQLDCEVVSLDHYSALLGRVARS